MRKKPVMTSVLIALILSYATDCRADTVYLKNGGSIDGIVTKEDGKAVVLDIGFGIVTFSKKDVDRIETSTPPERQALLRKWENKRKDLEKREKEFIDAREKRFQDYAQWIEEERVNRLKATRDSKTISLKRSPATNSLLVDAMLDGKVKATLVLDTGASICVVSKRIGEALGIDTTKDKNKTIKLQLLGKILDAKLILLRNLRIQEASADNVLAAVLLEEMGDPEFKDGLLGMSFLSKFNFQINLKEMSMSLEEHASGKR